MAVDVGTPRTRRALLGAALGAAAATAASALGRPLPSRAANGDPVYLGQSNSATNRTRISGPGLEISRASSDFESVLAVSGPVEDNAVFSASNSGSGYTTGVYGQCESPNGTAVMGYAAGATGKTTGGFFFSESPAGFGVRGEDVLGGTGVSGTSDGGTTGGATGAMKPTDTAPLPASPGKTGVYGYANNDSTARGVYGRTMVGRGVCGQATSGAGLYGTATTGYALRTSGRLKVEKASGVATIAAAASSVVVTPGLDVTTSSFVLLTPKADIGSRRLWYSTDSTNNRFTIRISSAVINDLKIGWLLLG
jgi:hypothetical protein